MANRLDKNYKVVEIDSLVGNLAADIEADLLNRIESGWNLEHVFQITTPTGVVAGKFILIYVQPIE